MIQLIVLTPEGDALELRHDDNRTENSPLIVRLREIGRHKYCWGRLFFVPISPSHHAIVCPQCNLRVPVKIPLTETATYSYGDLRKALETDGHASSS